NSSMPSILYNNIITSNIYILSLHDALPIYYIYSDRDREFPASDNLLGNINLTFGVITAVAGFFATLLGGWTGDWLRKRFANSYRSEEHTSELQSLRHLVCRLLLEKKKQLSN